MTKTFSLASPVFAGIATFATTALLLYVNAVATLA